MLPPCHLVAQQPQPAPAAYRYGKFAAVAAAIGFTALGIATHNQADRDYRALNDYCRTTGCAVGPDGRYTDATAEARYSEVVTGDRSARAWFIGGQAALAGAVALFILEVRHGNREPRNIPYHGLTVQRRDGALRIGWTVPFAAR
jgi:hypothetical protein